jgi:hypothetical protein
VEIAGNRVIRGGNNLADGPVTSANAQAAMKKVEQEKFAHEPVNATGSDSAV